MKKGLTYVALIAVVATCGSFAFALSDQDAVAAPRPAPSAAAANEKTIYGVIEYSDSWLSGTNKGLKTGVYSTTLDATSPFNVMSAVRANTYASNGGMYVDGYFYFMNGEVGSTKFSMTFNKMNVDTWQIEDMSAHYNQGDVATGMTYDYTTSTAYAVGPRYEGDNNALNGYRLSTIDLATGNFTEVASLGRNYSDVACDMNGQLWGLARSETYPYPASLYKIDKKTGGETLVGPLGVNQKSLNISAAFDYTDGKLYWAGRTYNITENFEEEYLTGIYEIDLTTGEAKLVKEFPTNEVLSVLFFVDSDPKAAAQISDVKFNYSANSLSQGKLSLTLPTTTYAGKTLSGKLAVEVAVDGKVVAEAKNLNPGAAWQSPALDLASGAHNVDVTCINAEGIRNLKKRIVVYSGFDAPAAVGNLKATTDKYDGVATITWDAPTAGKNGGNISGAQLSYNVRRRPDNKMVATGITELKFVDDIDRVMGITQYEVTPVLNGVEGVAANTPVFVAGMPHPLPYVETFDSNMDFMSYVTIDATNDACEDGNYWMYYPNYREAVWWMSYATYGNADDWMIAPAIDINQQRVYRLQFETHGYSTNPKIVTTFEVMAGEEATVESMKTTLLKQTIPNTESPLTVQVLFTAPENARRLGFHLTNNGQGHVALDNVRVTDYGPLTIAAAPVINSITSDKNGNVQLSVTLPTKTVEGKTIQSIDNLYLYGNNKRIAQKIAKPSLSSPTLTLTDSNPDRAVNSYIVVVETADGMGMEAYASIDVVPGTPKPVENVTVGSTGNQAIVKWNYPADMLDAEGGKLSESDITYNVYVGDEVIKGIKESQYIDENAVQRLGGATQGILVYYVEAVTESGSSRKIDGKGIIGEALELPYDQSFAPYDGMWTGSNFKYDTYSYDPMIREGQDDSSFMTLFGSYSSYAMSPRLNLTTLISPKLSFWVYKTAQTKFMRSTFAVGVEEVDDEGFAKPIKYLTSPESIAADADGWVKYEVDLAPYASAQRASIVFTVQNSGGRVHIDNISITGEYALNDMRLKSLTGPKRCLTGRENIYTVTVDNKGQQPAADFKVEFLVDGTVADTKTASLEAGEEMDMEFSYTPALNHPEVEKVITARVISTEEDFNLHNNERSLTVNVYYPDVPMISTLRATADADRITLSWNDPDSYPHSIAVFDNVEGYANNTIFNPGDWKTVDRDGLPTLNGISSSVGTFTWNHCGEPQAWIVFNPTYVGIEGLANAHSGDRCFVSFTTPSGANDDWLISPQLLGAKQTISFYARAMHPAYLNEMLEIAVSYTGDDVDDFEDIVATLRIASTSWRQYSVELPAGARYFAFHCVSSEQFGLMIDDITFDPVQPPVELWGYNVYRDGERVATEHPDNSYVDTDVALDEPHTYNVTAVYAQGESACSNTVTSAASSIDRIEAAATGVTITPAEGSVVIEGATGKVVVVANAAGQLIYNFVASERETLRLLPGLYIVKAGDTSAKISVR